MEQKHGKGSFWGLVPLLTFLVLYIITGVSTQNFNSMPLMIGILIASAVALMMHRKGEVDRTTFAQRVTKYCVGGGDDGLILMVIVFLLAGGFYGVSKGMHAVDAVTNLGLDILPVKLILPGLFVIGCIISFAMGTSMGTVAALMPIGVSLALKIHGNMALFCGTVVGSAMFGDNLSMISASVIAATRTQDVSMMKKFKTNIAMLLPAIIVNLVLLAMQPVGHSYQPGIGYFASQVNITRVICDRLYYQFRNGNLNGNCGGINADRSFLSVEDSRQHGIVLRNGRWKCNVWR